MYLNNLFLLFKKLVSPYINRFLSADTIVPGYANPQNLNRYSYVTNNPLRYIDPTGHMLSENEYGGGCSTSGYCPGDTPPQSPSNPPGGGNDGGGHDDNDVPESGGGNHTIPAPNPSVNLENSYCGDGPNGVYNFFDCAANVTQDLTVLVDAPFAFLELVLITAGCFAGPQGCLAGGGVGITIFNVSGANTAETIFSLSAAGFSIAADLTDDRRFGESTTVAVVSAGLGFLSPDPIIDLAIDGFGSAYNHEIKPISTLFDH